MAASSFFWKWCGAVESNRFRFKFFSLFKRKSHDLRQAAYFSPPVKWGKLLFLWLLWELRGEIFKSIQQSTDHRLVPEERHILFGVCVSLYMAGNQQKFVESIIKLWHKQKQPSQTWFSLSFFFFFAFSRAAPEAYGGPPARDWIGAAASGLRQSHSNAGSEPHLQPTPQLTAGPDP